MSINKHVNKIGTSGYLNIRLWDITYLTKIVHVVNFHFSLLNDCETRKSATLGAFRPVFDEKIEKNILFLGSWHIGTTFLCFSGHYIDYVSVIDYLFYSMYRFYSCNYKF